MEFRSYFVFIFAFAYVICVLRYSTVYGVAHRDVVLLPNAPAENNPYLSMITTLLTTDLPELGIRITGPNEAGFSPLGHWLERSKRIME